MRYLLDTCVISELSKPKPNANVTRWLSAAQPLDLHLSVITIAEIQRGTLRLAPGRRRARLAEWTEQLARSFAGRILPVEETIAARWAEIAARAEQSGRTASFADGLIAATALRHDMTLVTRNLNDFAPFPIKLFSPWDA